MQVIAVADHARELDLFGGDRFSAEYEAALERVLQDLFAASPGASDAWEEVAEGFDDEVGMKGAVPFCLERGFDIRKVPGRDGSGLVGCWRDIGIMLLARDRGLTS
jgi:hypothetical protein